MNTETAPEQQAIAEVEKSEVGALALITLDPARYVAEVFEPFRTKLGAIKAEAALIHFTDDQMRDEPYKYVDISTTVGMEIAIKGRAAGRNVRTQGEKARAERKAPLLSIGKLLDSEYKAIADEALQIEQFYDEAIKGEEVRKEVIKQAKIAAELARLKALEDRIQAIRDIPLSIIGMSSDEIVVVMDRLAAAPPVDFEEFIDRAVATHQDSLKKLETAMLAQHNREGQEKQRRIEADAAEQTRIAEAERMAAERLELARQRAKQQESARVAEIEKLRVLSEQAADRQKLLDQAAALEAQAKKQREQAEANARAHDAAMAKIERDAAEERDRVAAAVKAQIEAQQTEIAAQRKQLEDERAADAKAKQDAADEIARADALRLKLLADHEEALEIDALFDEHQEAERLRLQSCADQRLADHAPIPALADLAASLQDIELWPSNDEILGDIRTMFLLNYGMTIEQTDARMIRFDYSAAMAEGVAE